MDRERKALAPIWIPRLKVVELQTQLGLNIEGLGSVADTKQFYANHSPQTFLVLLLEPALIRNNRTTGLLFGTGQWAPLHLPLPSLLQRLLVPSHTNASLLTNSSSSALSLFHSLQPVFKYCC